MFGYVFSPWMMPAGPLPTVSLSVGLQAQEAPPAPPPRDPEPQEETEFNFVPETRRAGGPLIL